ncbi:MAG: MFS transporter [Acetilactobacillus jinshanensis]
MSKNQKLTLASTSAGFALENMDYNVVSFTMSSMIATLGISAAAGGLIPSVTNVGMLFGGILFGLLADRFGRVKIFSYTIFLFALATGLMYFANNIDLIYVLRFFGGFAEGGEFGAGVALLAENFPSNKIGRLTSYASIGGQIGAIITAGLAAVIIPHFGWHALFLVGLAPAIFAFFVRRNLKENPKKYDKKVSIRQLFTSPRMAWQTMGLILMVMVQVAGYYGLMNWLPSIMQKHLHISVSKSSLWMIVTIVGMCLGMWAFGTLMDHFSPRISYGIFLIAAAAAIYLITIAFNAGTLLFACTVVGFFTNGMYSGYGAVVSRLYPMNVRATANNFIMNVGKAVGGFSPAVIGLLMDHCSLVTVIMILSVMYLFSFVIMLTMPNLRKLKNVSKA